MKYEEIKEQFFLSYTKDDHHYIESAMSNYKKGDSKMYNKLWNYLIELSSQDGILWYLKNITPLDDTYQYLSTYTEDYILRLLRNDSFNAEKRRMLLTLGLNIVYQITGYDKFVEIASTLTSGNVRFRRWGILTIIDVKFKIQLYKDVFHMISKSNDGDVTDMFRMDRLFEDINFTEDEITDLIEFNQGIYDYQPTQKTIQNISVSDFGKFDIDDKVYILLTKNATIEDYISTTTEKYRSTHYVIKHYLPLDEEIRKYPEIIHPNNIIYNNAVFYMTRETLKVLNKYYGTKKKMPKVMDFSSIIRENTVIESILTRRYFEYLITEMKSSNKELMTVYFGSKIFREMYGDDIIQLGILQSI